MIDMATSSGTRRTEQRRKHEPAPQAQQRHHGTADRVSEPASECVKGIVDIRADMVLENADLLGHALTVLIGQWGLDVVELRVIENRPEAAGVTSGASQHVITIAGHSFPLVLEAW